MISNSQIFTTTVFGESSAMTAQELAQKNTATVEQYLRSYSDSNMRTKIPVVPSNQKIAKDR